MGQATKEDRHRLLKYIFDQITKPDISEETKTRLFELRCIEQFDRTKFYNAYNKVTNKAIYKFTKDKYAVYLALKSDKM